MTSLILLQHFPNLTAVGRYSCSGRVVMPPLLSDRIRASRKPEITQYAFEDGTRLNVPREAPSRNQPAHWPSRTDSPLYACSSCAYRSINFFVPRPGKLTDTRRSSSSPSTPTIVPTPKLGWRTLRPSMGLESPPRLAAGRRKEVWAGWRRGAATACFGPPRTRRRNSSGEYEYSGSGS